MSSENNLDELYTKTWNLISELSNDHKAVDVASVLINQALTIYKTVMSDEEFNLTVDAISASRDKIKTIEGLLI